MEEQQQRRKEERAQEPKNRFSINDENGQKRIRRAHSRAKSRFHDARKALTLEKSALKEAQDDIRLMDIQYIREIVATAPPSELV